MKTLVYTSQYKKDFKRYKTNQKKMSALLSVLQMLANEQPLPPQMRPHKLTGNYAGCLECHVENDFLLIWIDENTDIIKLLRLGSHSELFG